MFRRSNFSVKKDVMLQNKKITYLCKLETSFTTLTKFLRCIKISPFLNHVTFSLKKCFIYSGNALSYPRLVAYKFCISIKKGERCIIYRY